jgi:hypothetical protein
MLSIEAEANRIAALAMSRSAAALPGTTDPYVPPREQRFVNRIEHSNLLNVDSVTWNVMIDHNADARNGVDLDADRAALGAGLEEGAYLKKKSIHL